MYVVIMAGGRGTRFWPRSRTTKPKQLLDIVGEQTMIQQTVERVLPIAAQANILIVTHKNQVDALKQQLPDIPPENIIAEPLGRNTAPCICLAAAIIQKKDPEAVMAVLPADHYIGDPSGYCECILKAVQAAKNRHALVTIGIRPDRPETGYGYIEFDQNSGLETEEIYRVVSYHEKPDTEKANQYLSRGNYLWNSGMFVWPVATILQNIERFLPNIYREVTDASGAFGTSGFTAILTQAYEKIESISIDYGVMEKTESVLTFEGDFGWNDIGSWSAIYDISKKDKNGNVLSGDVIPVDSRELFVYNKHKLTAVVGLANVVVVETDDALLICSKDRVQDVRNVVDVLEKRGDYEYL